MSVPTPASSPVLRQRLARAVAAARGYLLERQSPAGGFCFYRGYYIEEPSLADTWHGVEAWAALTEAPLPAAMRHAAFVLGQPIEPQPFALYYRMQTLRRLKLADPAAPAMHAAVTALPLRLPPLRGGALQTPLRRLTYSLRLKQALDIPADAAAALAETLRAAEAPDGGYGDPPNLHDTAEALAVLASCHAEAGPRTAPFVAKLAQPDCGFRLTAHALSPSLETTAAGMACCARLGVPIAHAMATLGFILDCQTGDGGFARRPGALPDLAWTHLALHGLRHALGVPTLQTLAADAAA